ncbi:uncharacterized protein DUF4912 [Orenia metallireducens]|jgi:hypothetical protein|uniref:DUF4912 domain-containing protein n=1 Tax=Orenia metallireducens TaxID=1413210 RepID=A0A285H5F6_9FIRM|nr:DUF4912 domain-containing protein [Orenia metallireducens]PRX28636.1 uncharacterized protein DUF4912 [Orenia metallireducens]SNY30945.1 protein of unknown function [Orenia metallireducens]
MALLLTFLVLAIVIYFFSLSRDDNIKDSNRKKQLADIHLKQMNYSMESSKELTEIENILTEKNKLRTSSHKSNSNLLISNYWRRSLAKDDVEFARIPGDNNRINLNNITNYETADEEFWELFNRNKLILLAKDPDWIYTYWNVTGLETEKTKPIIRIYDVTNNQDDFFDVNISPAAGNWYIKAPNNNHHYYGEIGLLTENNIFIPLAESNSVFIPTKDPHKESSGLWMKVINGKKSYVDYCPKGSLDYTPELHHESSGTLFKD